MYRTTYLWRTGKTIDKINPMLVLSASLGRVASHRFIVITGPRAGGRAQFIQRLVARSGEQVLDLDTMSQGELVTQEMFESRIMHKLIWQFSTDKVNNSLHKQ